jgi:hypothetical protein
MRSPTIGAEEMFFTLCVLWISLPTGFAWPLMSSM